MKNSVDLGGVIHQSRSALLFIENISLFSGVLSFHSMFFCLPKIAQPCPQVFSVNGSITCSGLHF